MEIEKEHSSSSLDEDEDENEDGNDNEENIIDPQYTQYLQNSFQDEIVENIYKKIISYISDQALPLCEYIEYDDVEELINIINLNIQ